MDDSRFICPECKDTGIVYYNGENGYLYARPCKCRAVKEAKMRIERSGLAKLFKSKTFDSFKTYSDPILEDAKRTAMRFAETFESHGEEEANSLLLCGQVGAGTVLYRDMEVISLVIFPEGGDECTFSIVEKVIFSSSF